MDLRLHRRLPALAALAVGLALATSSCETLSGSGKSGAELALERTQLSETRAALNRATQEGDLQRVGPLLSAIRVKFDAIEAKSSSMNLLDREHLAIKIATGRRTIAEAERWVPVNDVEAVRSQIAELDPMLGEIDVLLDRAVKSSETPSTQTP
jgi:hypothetical protein